VALTAFFMNDVFGSEGTVATTGPSGESNAGPLANALNDRPRQIWQTDSNAYYCIDAGTYIDIAEGGGPELSISLPFMNGTADQIATKMSNSMTSQSVAGLTYTVLYNPTTGKFRISATGTFSLLFATGTHASSGGVQPWLGFEKFDNTGRTQYDADEMRYGTDHWAVFDLGSAKGFTLGACILDGGADVNWNSASDSVVKLFGASTNLSSTERSKWVSGAAKSLTFSNRPNEDQNRIQVAFDTDGAAMGYRYWAFSWRYFDDDTFHAVGLLKALVRYGSSTRQVAQLKGHGLVDTTKALNVKSYYPTQSMLTWKAPLIFDNWEASDYRDVVTEVVRNGRAKGLVWALRWSKIADGTYDADDEADKGFLLWAALQQYGQDTYGGAASDYISGELTLEQVR